MEHPAPRVIHVRQGRVEPSGSWLYVWVDVDASSVEYIGGTGFDPELRAYLHVSSHDHEVGRVRAIVPSATERDFDVLAFGLPDAVSRPDAKVALMDRLAGRSGTADHPGLDDVVGVIAEAVAVHLRMLDKSDR
ncbi:hypothetical protein NQ152_07490 [Microbacterium sp. zg.B48]|uniref:hypothetical protein n=1 Tax=Microbacterium sp. zg.B48 TaxID=2969408 RepID=UPI00214B714B|nr:hypothetical protein [Microbacterium sp. zg.B48]MCR2763352.1 hypothetical protein [Microbacterium sp. zg.B48]